MIGLATDRELPELSGGEQLLYRALCERKNCRILIWDNPDETWRECDEIIVRCTWDYSWRIIEFLKWIDKVEAAGIRLHNAPNILRWNSDKLYLRDLAARGVAIPPTVWIGREKLTRELLVKHVTGPCVIKPTVSAGAYNTLRVSPETIEEVLEKLAPVNREKGFMLQPFMPEVVEPGEYSLIFLRKEFSHAVLKTPAAGDFRVQPRYGGVQGAAQMNAETIGQARAILDAIPFTEEPLYARVDGVLRDGRFVLMELELIEPYLFWEFGDGAAAKFASVY